jgi:hypothetical protein
VENIGADMLIIGGDEFAGALIDNDEARGIGGADLAVGVVDAVATVDVEQVAVDEDRALHLIVNVNAGLLDQIADPEDVGIGGAGLERGITAQDHVAGFVLEGAIVAVGHAFHVEADDLATIGQDIGAISFNGRRRGEAYFGPIEEFVMLLLGNFRHHQLPEEMAIVFVETQQHIAVSLMAGIAGMLVVGADEHAAAGDDGRGVTLRAKVGDPLDVLAGGGVEAVGQSLFS